MGRRRRRRHSAEFKASVVDGYLRLGVPVAAVALAHELAAKLLRKWVIDGEHRLVAPGPAAPASRFRSLWPCLLQRAKAMFALNCGALTPRLRLRQQALASVERAGA